MEPTFRSSCPISSALDIMGDKWTLLIIRDMMFGGKSTFKDFSNAQEKIATGILASRLKRLVDLSLITKGTIPENKKTVVYSLTEKGIDLLPIVVELILWSDKQLRDHVNQPMRELAKNIRKDKPKFIERYTRKLLSEISERHK
ncbi:MAG: helix-turn-helix domain-containing protein [Cyclobacteriaceae bacterium]